MVHPEILGYFGYFIMMSGIFVLLMVVFFVVCKGIYDIVDGISLTIRRWDNWRHRDRR